MSNDTLKQAGAFVCFWLGHGCSKLIPCESDEPLFMGPYQWFMRQSHRLDVHGKIWMEDDGQ